jgi:hypothetical protein
VAGVERWLGWKGYNTLFMIQCNDLSAACKLFEEVTINHRVDIKHHRRSHPSLNHEVIFVTNHRNLSYIDEILMNVSDSKNIQYNKFFTRKELSHLTVDPSSVDHILDYLRKLKIDEKSIVRSIFDDYISATASVSTWEKSFGTSFHSYSLISKLNRDSNDTVETIGEPFSRALHFSLPHYLTNHIYTVLNTVQFPPSLSPSRPLNSNSNKEIQEKVQKNLKNSQNNHFSATSSSPGAVTPSLLNKVYSITSNKGSNLTSQAIFGALNQQYSPNDLFLFQEEFSLLPHSNPLSPPPPFSDKYSNLSACLPTSEKCADASFDLNIYTRTIPLMCS